MDGTAFRRDVGAEAERLASTLPPGERVRQALRLGEVCLDVYLATLPAGTSRGEARRRAELAKGRGRRTSGEGLK